MLLIAALSVWVIWTSLCRIFVQLYVLCLFLHWLPWISIHLHSLCIVLYVYAWCMYYCNNTCITVIILANYVNRLMQDVSVFAVRLTVIWMTNHSPSVLWHCWLGHQTCKKISPPMWPVIMYCGTIPRDRGYGRCGSHVCKFRLGGQTGAAESSLLSVFGFICFTKCIWTQFCIR